MCGGGLVLAVQPVSAQQFQVWPSFRDTNGPSIEIETEDNVRCRFTHGARPSFSVAGLSSNPNYAVDGNFGNSFNSYNGAYSSQLGGGVLLNIPFGGTPVDGCGRLAALQEQRSKLALAASLLEQGLITQEQFQQLGASIAKKLGITGPGPSPSAPSARAVYVPPPPVNTGGAGTNPAAARPPASQSGGATYPQRFPPLNTGAGAGPGLGIPAGANRVQPGTAQPAAGTRSAY